MFTKTNTNTIMKNLTIKTAYDRSTSISLHDYQNTEVFLFCFNFDEANQKQVVVETKNLKIKNHGNGSFVWKSDLEDLVLKGMAYRSLEEFYTNFSININNADDLFKLIENMKINIPIHVAHNDLPFLGSVTSKMHKKYPHMYKTIEIGLNKTLIVKVK